MKITFKINGKPYIYESYDEKTTLLYYLRKVLHFTGTKNGCAEGHCGACTVLVNKKAVLSCKTYLKNLNNADITTIEGLSGGGKVHALIYSFVAAGAVQCGFCTPGFIMSSKALLAESPEPTEEEIKKALTRNICRCTGYRKIFKALKMASELIKEGREWISRKEILPDRESRIGESIIRIDGIERASGAILFADDLFPDKGLYTRVCRSAKAHAEILDIDISEAQNTPGVVKVLLAGDIPGINLYGPIKKDQPVLCTEKVLYNGDAVAAVFAETEEAAAEGAEKIIVTYRDLPVLSGYEEALAPEAPLLHEAPDNILASVVSGRGNTAEGFAQASLIIEGEYETQYIEHAYMEPESCVAVPERDGSLTVYVASQGPTADIGEIAPVVGLAKEKIRIVGMPMGGGFGGKEDISVQIIAALGALATGRPVKYTFSRRESIRTSGKRHAAKLKYKTGVTDKGLITAIEAKIQARGGAYASLEEAVIVRSSSFASGPYTIPAADISGKAVYQNHAPACAMRGFGNPVVTFGSEMNMNRIAERLNIDPIELRLINALEEGKPTLTGDRPCTSVGIKECLKSVKAFLENYRQPEPDEGWAAGIGIACSYKNVGLGLGMDDFGGAIGEILPDGSLLLRVGCVDMGQGSNTVMAQILSAQTGWPYNRIKVHSADTLSDPPAGMTTASRQTFVTGNAVVRMAEKLNAEIGSFILTEIEKDNPGMARLEQEKTIKLKSGAFYGADSPIPLLSFEDFLKLIRKKGIKITASARYEAPETRFSLKEPAGGYKDPVQGRLHAAYCFAAQATALCVHKLTGKVKVQDVFIACDAGRTINRAAIEGQMEGGVVMGLGYALTEEYKEEQGIVKTDTLARLGIPRIGFCPNITCEVIENPHTEGPLGAKGMGELPVSMGPPSVAHAVYKALGIWITSLPITPEKILAALKE